jgi:ubiquitin-like protein Pup
MAKQTQKSKSTTKKAEAPVEEVPEVKETSKEDWDKIMDDIDEVLEDNAEEFTRSYVQKGGE